MKTPHRITLVYTEETQPKYNPITNEYERTDTNTTTVPCFANYVTKQRVFEQYGDRKDRVLIVRFNQEQEPFDQAIFKGKSYLPIESIDAPIKGAIRLKEVSDG